MQVIELRRNRAAKILARQSIFGISTVHGVAGEGWRVAQVFHSATAVCAGAIGAAKPGNTNPRAALHAISCAHFPHNLVARNDAGMQRREFTLNDVQIGTTHATGTYSQQHVPWHRLGNGDVFDSERRIRNRSWTREHRGFHKTSNDILNSLRGEQLTKPLVPRSHQSESAENVTLSHLLIGSWHEQFAGGAR